MASSRPSDGEDVGAGVDDEVLVQPVPHVGAGADLAGHLLGRDDFLAGHVAAALGEDLVLDVHAGHAHRDQPLGDPGGVDGVAAAGVDVGHDRDVHGLDDVPGHVQDVLHLHEADVGLAEAGRGQAVAGDLDGLEAGLFDDLGREGVVAAGHDDGPAVHDGFAQDFGFLHVGWNSFVEKAVLYSTISRARVKGARGIKGPYRRRGFGRPIRSPDTYGGGPHTKLEGVSVEPFRGDFEGLERMAHASWRDEYGEASFPNFYRPAFLHYLFDRIPAGKRDHLLAAYKGGEIVAFLANLPQKFHFRGGLYSAVYSCLLVVRKEYPPARPGPRDHPGRGRAEQEVRLRLLASDARDRAPLDPDDGEARRRRPPDRADPQVRRHGPYPRPRARRRLGRPEGLRKGGHPRSSAPAGRPRPSRASTCGTTAPSDLDACHALLDRYKDTTPPGSGLGQARPGRRARISERRPDPRLGEGRPRPGPDQLRSHDQLGKSGRALRLDQPRRLSRPLPGRAGRVPAGLPRRIREDGFVATIDFDKRGWPAGPFYRARFIPYPRAVNLVSWTFNPEISLAGIPVVYEIQV